MGFAQRCALFRHLNFQKVVGDRQFFTLLTWKCASRHNGVHFFRHLNFQKVVRDCQVFTLLTWKCASRHNGVQFSSLIWPDGSAPAALASLLFDLPEPHIIGKTQWIATFLPFRVCIFFLLTLSLLWSSHFLAPLWLFPPLLFHLSILSEVWLLNFLRLCRSYPGISIVQCILDVVR